MMSVANEQDAPAPLNEARARPTYTQLDPPRAPLRSAAPPADDESETKRPADPRRARPVLDALAHASKRDPARDVLKPVGRGAFVIWMTILAAYLIAYLLVPPSLYQTSLEKIAPRTSQIQNWIGPDASAQPAADAPVAAAPTASTAAAAEKPASPAAKPSASLPNAPGSQIANWAHSTVNFGAGLVAFTMYLVAPVLEVFPHKLKLDAQSSVAVFIFGTLVFAGYYVAVYLLGIPLARAAVATGKGLHRRAIRPAIRAVGRARLRARERRVVEARTTSAGTQPKLQ